MARATRQAPDSSGCELPVTDSDRSNRTQDRIDPDRADDSADANGTGRAQDGIDSNGADDSADTYRTNGAQDRIDSDRADDSADPDRTRGTHDRSDVRNTVERNRVPHPTDGAVGKIRRVV